MVYRLFGLLSMVQRIYAVNPGHRTAAPQDSLSFALEPEYVDLDFAKPSETPENHYSDTVLSENCHLATNLDDSVVKNSQPSKTALKISPLHIKRYSCWKTAAPSTFYNIPAGEV